MHMLSVNIFFLKTGLNEAMTSYNNEINNSKKFMIYFN